jgi:hypothetical protein
MMGLLQLLTPDRDAVAVVAKGNQEATILLMSNSTSSSAQLDASKASNFFTALCHSYEAVCYFQCLIAAMIADLGSPLVLQKLLEYTPPCWWTARAVCSSSPTSTPLPWRSTLGKIYSLSSLPFAESPPTQTSMGWSLEATRLRITITVPLLICCGCPRLRLVGNPQQEWSRKFEGTPICAPWFAPVAPPRSVVPVVTPRSSPAPATGGGEPKCQKTQFGSGGERNKTAPGDTADSERKKALGILTFDPTAAGTHCLPHVMSPTRIGMPRPLSVFA